MKRRRSGINSGNAIGRSRVPRRPAAAGRSRRTTIAIDAAPLQISRSARATRATALQRPRRQRAPTTSNGSSQLPAGRDHAIDARRRRRCRERKDIDPIATPFHVGHDAPFLAEHRAFELNRRGCRARSCDRVTRRARPRQRARLSIVQRHIHGAVVRQLERACRRHGEIAGAADTNRESRRDEIRADHRIVRRRQVEEPRPASRTNRDSCAS